MTPTSPSAVLPVTTGTADNLRALRLLVVAGLVLDGASTFRDLRLDQAPWGVAGLETLQLLLVPAAAAALMWLRPWLAAGLSSSVLVLALVGQPTSEEPWLVLVAAVVVGARARLGVVVLVAVAQLGYVVAFGWRVDRRYPGDGGRTALLVLAFAAAGWTVGLVVRRLLRAGERRRERLAEIRVENAEIRTTERRRLADDLQTVVTGGLAAIGRDQESLEAGDVDGPALRRGLDRIEQTSRSVLTELRTLLEVLRREGPAPGPELVRPRRRLGEVVTARSVRLAASATFVLLGLRALTIGAGVPAEPGLVVQALGWAAAAAAPWAPRVAAVLATVALAVSVGSRTPTDWDALPLVVLFFLGAMRARLRRLWIVLLGFVAYALLLSSTAREAPDRLLVASYAAAIGIAAGLAAGHFVQVERVSAARQASLLADRERVEVEERTAVARDLHDVVAHQLSLTTLMIMGTSASTDPLVLTTTLRQVAECVDTTGRELDSLLRAMRGSETDDVQPSPLVLPSAGAEAFAERLSASGYRPEIETDPQADDLDPTTQRTLGRIMQEATTNIVRYAPAGSRCRYSLTVDSDLVRLTVESPLSVQDGRSRFSLGWGLRGVAERVALSRGTFTAGPERGEWRVEVALPRLTDRVAVTAESG